MPSTTSARTSVADFDQQDLAAIWEKLNTGVTQNPFPPATLPSPLTWGGNVGFGGGITPADGIVSLNYGVSAYTKQVTVSLCGKGAEPGVCSFTITDQGGNDILTSVLQFGTSYIYQKEVTVLLPYGMERNGNQLKIQVVNLDGDITKVWYGISASIYTY